MATPTSTYRVQLTPDFGLRDAAAVVPYLASLGVSHLYLSPILEASPGSSHGYDVVDHDRISTERGGIDGWRVLQSALREHGLGCVVDIVPNHMALPVPESANPALWSVLRDGRAASTARWFDVDWAAGGDRLVLPVLGSDQAEAIANGELVRDGELVRYHDHEFPIAPETAGLPWPDVLAAQHYTLIRWSAGADSLNYRRFFDVSELIGLRVEDDEVFHATHRLLLELVARGDIQGLRVDHPDGLADPRGYLRRLRAAAPDTWIVVEKILAAGESLPADWPCDGTTGYDTLRVVDAAFVDPVGVRPLAGVHQELTGERRPYASVTAEAKHQVLADVLDAERARLHSLASASLPQCPPAMLGAALDELLVAMPVYRTYLVPGEPVGAADAETVDRARRAAEEALGHAAPLVRELGDLLLGRRPRSAPGDELVLRFQQVASALTAKGVEDTAGYRWHVLPSQCEVGGEPGRLDIVSPDAFHAHAVAQPAGAMTTLSTHDTKRSEDVRARLAVLSELPGQWRDAVSSWCRKMAGRRVLDPPTDYLLWQSVVGAWPLDPERLAGYLLKACREAKRATSWLAPDRAYEDSVAEYARTVLADDRLRAEIDAFVAQLHPAWVTNLLAAKLVQLTMPGVPDCYQGAEALHLALVDPDNRRPVDYGHLGGLLVHLDQAGGPPQPEENPDAAKLYVTSRTLRLRRDRPDLFTTYQALAAHGSAADHALAFSRGDAITVVPRLPASLQRAGGWRDTSLALPAGAWTDVFTRRGHEGTVRLGELLDQLPVALLARHIALDAPAAGSSRP